MDAAPGRLAWLALTPDDVRLLDLAVTIGAPGGEVAVFAPLATKVAAQAKNRFGAIRLSHQEIQALGAPFKQLLDQLRHWQDVGDGSVRAAILAQYGDSVDAAVLAQRVQAFRVKIGLQKGWTKAGGIPPDE